MDTPDGLTLAIGGTAFGALCGLLGAWIKARYSRTEIAPNPLKISSTSFDRLAAENEDDHRNLFYRMSVVEKKISAIEERTAGITSRLDRIESKLDRLIEGTQK